MTTTTHGVISTADNRYLMATVRSASHGGCTFKSWSAHDWLANHSLWSRGIRLGVRAQWRRRLAAGEAVDMVQALDETSVFVTSTSRAALDAHRECLAYNLVEVLPDDIYLATVPLTYVKSCPASFLSLHFADGCCCVGVVVERTLTAVFRLLPSGVEAVESHLGRIVRYLSIRCPEVSVPRIAYLLGDGKPVVIDGWELAALSVPNVSTVDEMKALGLALVDVAPVQPAFDGASDEAHFRVVRTGLVWASIAAVALTLAAVLGVVGANAWYTRSLAQFKTEYRQVLDGNVEIKSMLDDNSALAVKINRLQATLQRQPSWTSLLSTLADTKPAGLYLDRVGTNPVSGTEKVVQVALSGWAEEERSVTDFISGLQKVPALSDVELKVMERDDVRKDLLRFRIICTLKLSNG